MADKTIKDVIKHLLSKGEIIRITSGEYDEYDVIAICKVLKDFDILDMEETRRWELGKHYNEDADEKYAWLLENGILEPTEENGREWNLHKNQIYREE